MWRTLGISKTDWHNTPPGVQSQIFSLHHQAHSFQLRCTAYKVQINALQQQSPAIEIQQLKERIAQQQKQIRSLQQQVQETNLLSAQIQSLKSENAHLKERLGQNSNNSSLPPSSDSPFRKRKRAVEPSGRRQGAQIGHRGVGRKLKPVEEVDAVIDLRPESCAGCGTLLLGDDHQPARRQVTEITAAGTLLIEYRRHSIYCLSCGRLNRVAWPGEAQKGAFGPKVKAVVGYLTGRLGASHRDTVEALQELFKVKIGLGSIASVQRQISKALAEPIAEVQEFVQQQAVSYVDETTWNEKNQQNWLWVSVTATAIAFWIAAGRSTKDAQRVIGKNAKAIITTDRYPGYNFLQGHLRQVCWAHLKRDFQAIAERDGDSKSIGQGLLEQTKHLFVLWQAVRDGTLMRAVFQLAIEPIKEKVNELLIAGTVSTNEKTKRTCQNLIKLEYSLWTFTRVEGVEPTNNAAERALRRAVIWRRKSFGTQSEAGSRFVERILTVVTTLRQQCRSVLDYLKQACMAAQTATAISMCKSQRAIIPSLLPEAA